MGGSSIVGVSVMAGVLLQPDKGPTPDLLAWDPDLALLQARGFLPGRTSAEQLGQLVRLGHRPRTSVDSTVGSSCSSPK
jgi:hypothetical protein